MLSEVAEAVRAREVASRLRDEDLATVACGGDPRGTVDVDADVTLSRYERLAGVETHANANGTA